MRRHVGLLQRGSWGLRASIAAALVLGTGLGARAIISNLTLVATLHEAQAEHLDQEEIVELVENNQTEEAFEEAFEHGDELFETVFNALDGVGANVGQGQRFTRVPRADLTGAGEWANHTPARSTGPNAQACNSCHLQPADDGAGSIAGNVHRDPGHTGIMKKFIERSTPHLFGAGAVQRLAEEMSADLQAIRAGVIQAACAGALFNTKRANLDTKGVRFGTFSADRRSTGEVCPPPFTSRRFHRDTSDVKGVDVDLVVKPFQWKGSVAFLRDFNRGASHNELGMQAVELVGAGTDGDFDGVTNEMTIGDQTALAIYLSAQPRPVTHGELAALGLIEPLTATESGAIANGAVQFARARCDSCHKPVLELEDALFSEPSQSASYRDSVFPAGQNPIAEGVDPAFPVTYDLTADLPDNRIETSNGIVTLGNHVSNGQGGALISLYGDLKRHDMGTSLAEGIDEVGTGRATFLTENLWGVGSTAPYLHDGRATTLTEAILEHGGEASTSRSAFLALSPANQADVITFLDSLMLFKAEEG